MTRREWLFGGLGLAFAGGDLEGAAGLVQDHVSSGYLAAAVLDVQVRGRSFQRAFGAARNMSAVFLLASITKPMTATGVMVLADLGELSLEDPVEKFIPDFRGGGRERVRIRHLLTHTSGLPDMLPENEELRKRHAPLADFVAATCRTPLLFSPGSQVSYQSMGILLAAEIVQRITRRPLPDFLRETVFLPLRMRDTSLGMGGRNISETMQCQVAVHDDWDWNSPYWRNLASPWGGALAPAPDVTRLLEYFHHPDSRVLKPETAAAMLTDQNRGLNQPWGIGWMLTASHFGKGCSPRTFGHNGSTGTTAWLDPAHNLSCVLLTTKPAALSEKTVLRPVSDIVSSAAGKL